MAAATLPRRQGIEKESSVSKLAARFESQPHANNNERDHSKKEHGSLKAKKIFSNQRLTTKGLMGFANSFPSLEREGNYEEEKKEHGNGSHSTMFEPLKHAAHTYSNGLRSFGAEVGQRCNDVGQRCKTTTHNSVSDGAKNTGKALHINRKVSKENKNKLRRMISADESKENADGNESNSSGSATRRAPAVATVTGIFDKSKIKGMPKQKEADLALKRLGKTFQNVSARSRVGNDREGESEAEKKLDSNKEPKLFTSKSIHQFERFKQRALSVSKPKPVDEDKKKVTVLGSGAKAFDPLKHAFQTCSKELIHIGDELCHINRKCTSGFRGDANMKTVVIPTDDSTRPTQCRSTSLGTKQPGLEALSATKIQALWRGFLQRRSQLKKKNNQDNSRRRIDSLKTIKTARNSIADKDIIQNQYKDSVGYFRGAKKRPSPVSSFTAIFEKSKYQEMTRRTQSTSNLARNSLEKSFSTFTAKNVRGDNESPESCVSAPLQGDYEILSERSLSRLPTHISEKKKSNQDSCKFVNDEVQSCSKKRKEFGVTRSKLSDSTLLGGSFKWKREEKKPTEYRSCLEKSNSEVLLGGMTISSPTTENPGRPCLKSSTVDKDKKYGGILRSVKKKGVIFQDDPVDTIVVFDTDEKEDTNHSFLDDEKFLKSKVFEARLRSAAIKIQTWWRCFSAAGKFKQNKDRYKKNKVDRELGVHTTKIQRRWRGILSRRKYQKALLFKARQEAQRVEKAVKIQAFFRGFLGRCDYKIAKLEKKCKKIEAKKEKSLLKVEDKKQKRMRLIEKEELDIFYLVHKLKKNDEIAFELKDQNNALQKELSEHMRRTMLVRQNSERLSKNVGSSRKLVKSKERELKPLKEAIDRYNRKLNKYKTGLAEMQQELMKLTMKTVKEQSDKKKTKACIKRINCMIADRCSQKSLVKEVRKLRNSLR